MELYMDTIVGGEVVRKGKRDCAGRYEAIREVLSRFTRPVTTLDIGANTGYFSFRIAQDFPATAVMIEMSPQLLDLCIRNNCRNTVFLNKKVGARHLARLAECEHFDVVLAFNILHHLDNSMAAVRSVLHLGDHIFIETPPKSDRGACGQSRIAPVADFLESEGGTKVAQTPRHTSTQKADTYYFRRDKKSIEKPYWEAPFAPAQNGYQIHSDYGSKQLVIPRKQFAGEWRPGINYYTFLKLNGRYPLIPTRLERLNHLALDPHPDKTLWNIVIQGSEIFWVDCGHDPGRRNSGNEFHRHIEELERCATK
jgi:SAM-dependent methyltransferase